jgi:hypothetical protein
VDPDDDGCPFFPVSDDIFAELRRHFDEGEIVEITCVLGSSPTSTASTKRSAWRLRERERERIGDRELRVVNCEL